MIQNSEADAHNIVQKPPRIMDASFSPLALLAALHDLPQNYAQRITLYDGEGNFTAQHHADRFNDFIDLEEVDHEDAKMIFFYQSLSGEGKKWFKDLPARSIPTFEEFQTLFIDRWEYK